MQILTKETLQTVLEQRLGSPVSITGSESNYLCPFCAKTGEKHHLHVNYEKGERGAATCHTCWYGTRDLTRLIRDVYGHMPRNIARLQAREVFVTDVESVLRETAEEEGAQATPLPRSFTRVPKRGKGMGAVIREYLEGRGFTYDDIDRYGIGFLTDKRDRAYGYAILPYYMHGVCVYWQGRSVAPNPARFKSEPPRYYNPPSTNKEKLFFGFDQAINNKRIVLVEGPFDAIATPGGMGLTSKNLSRQQVRLLSLMDVREIIVCLDLNTWDDKINATYGRKRVSPYKEIRPLYYAKWLSKSTSSRVGFLRLTTDKDPAELRERMPFLLTTKTQWIENDLVRSVEGILRDF